PREYVLGHFLRGGQHEHRLGGREKDDVTTAAGEELDPRIGLPSVNLEIQGQFVIGLADLRMLLRRPGWKMRRGLSRRRSRWEENAADGENRCKRKHDALSHHGGLCPLRSVCGAHGRKPF